MGSYYPSILSELEDDEWDHIIGSLSRHRKNSVSSISNASPVLVMIKCEPIFMIIKCCYVMMWSWLLLMRKRLDDLNFLTKDFSCFSSTSLA
jgi:hypothetical protein